MPSAIPADCRVNASEIDVDQAALTGESLPVTFYKGDSCKMGSTVVRGEVNATVEFTGSDTFFGKTASLLQQSDEHSHLQKMLMRIMFVLVGLSVTLCLISFIYLVVDGESVKESLSFVSLEPLVHSTASSLTLLQYFGHNAIDNCSFGSINPPSNRDSYQCNSCYRIKVTVSSWGHRCSSIGY